MLTYFIAILLIVVTAVAFVAFVVMAFESVLTLVAFLFRLLSVPFDVQAFFKRRKASHNGFEDAFGK